MSERFEWPRKVVMVDGCRTPFVRSGTDLAGMSAADMGAHVARELLQRTSLPGNEVDEVVFGSVIPDVKAPNIAREVVYHSLLPRSVEAYSVSRACATSNQAIASAAQHIALGAAEVVIAGGAESMSSVPILVSPGMNEILMSLSRARTMGQRLRLLSKLRPKHLLPDPPALAEAFTGLTMGQSCEKMARENAISREEQDEVALRSHQRAARAQEEGTLAQQISPVFVPPKYRTYADKDNFIRPETSLEALAKLRPSFDRKYGTLTPGNSSGLTDGAAAVLLMAEDRARALGYSPMGRLVSYAFAALDPFDQLLQGPAYAIPKALDKAGLQLSDIGLVEMHEAFAAQVLSNLQALGSETFARENLGRDAPVGEIDPEILNVNGGSIALGHPFAATGARLCTNLLREMSRRDVQYGLVSVCAAGALGAAMIWEKAS